jgi:hypothetical protein
LVEHLLAYAVKRKMARVKMILVWLIPILWLGASIECLSEVAGGVPHKLTGPALSPGQCGNREPSIAVCSLEQSARRLGRRLDVESGPEKLHPPAAIFERYYPRSAQPAFSSAHSQPALELTQSWQFLWRTAIEPRAPSSVS